jgi:hypothetical protein
LANRGGATSHSKHDATPNKPQTASRLFLRLVEASSRIRHHVALSLENSASLSNHVVLDAENFILPSRDVAWGLRLL